MSLEGQQLGEFEILERLGQGGMGAVYKARQTSLDRFVAIKTLQTALAEDAEYIARFRQEAKAAAVLNHPNLVQVYSAGESEGMHWFAMEYVEGESAKVRLKRKGRLDPLEAIAIGIHVATALEYGWRKASLIHRDIKPDNIFLSTDGEVKLGDLGLAKSAGQTQGLTMTGASMGTPHYISPEQVVAMKDVDLRADIYSLGCSLYHLLSGQAPFEGNSAVAIMMQHVNGPVPDLRKTWPECSPGLVTVVEKMMQKQPAERQQDYAEVITDLRRAYEAVSHPPVVEKAVPTPKPVAQAKPVVAAKPRAVAAPPSPSAKQSKTPLYTGITAGVLIIAVVAFFLFRPKEESLTAAQRWAHDHAAEQATGGFFVTATQDAPFVNSLGMKFVPVPVTGGPTAGQPLLFSVWDTRVQDYEKFVKETKHEWPKADFDQGPTHPAVNVSWDDAEAFCAWLTDQEHQAGKLPTDEQYRLPSDHEWSCAVGIGEQEDATKLPTEKNGKINAVFPWGTQWPPPQKAGNYASEELKPLQAVGKFTDIKEVIPGYHDGYANTSPVGSYAANSFGLYDMGGNVWQLCEDWFDKEQKEHVTRGASWSRNERSQLQSSYRLHSGTGLRNGGNGFRCIIAPISSAPVAVAPAPVVTSTPAAATNDSPFVNSLGMKFVPVPIIGGPTGGQPVLFSVWDTRVQDYEQFVKETKHEWPKPDFDQGPTHPAVKVSWDDAKAFCLWLTEREHKSEKLPMMEEYRLPTDHEWSCAVGIADKEDASKLPVDKSGKITDTFPWGTQWPPQAGAGNYAGEEMRQTQTAGKYNDIKEVISGYNDGFVNTSPVGSFAANDFGLLDIGGNVQQWCEDWNDKDQKERVLRGSSWRGMDRIRLLSSGRSRNTPGGRYDSAGFRCVLAPILASAESSVVPEAAAKNSPFVNTLSMKFVPVPGTNVLFSIWDTRVQDYKVYATANKVDDSWTRQQRDNVPVSRDPDYPIVGVSWDDAQGFNQWLTNKEITGGKLPKGAKYRLPTDEEWSVAVGLPPELGTTPAEKAGRNSVDFPWGKDYPPTKKVGNYADETFHGKFPKDTRDKREDQPWIEGYTDGYATTSPVGSFPTNAYGLYDMGGNVFQWCDDWFDASHKDRVLRGASWTFYVRLNLLSSYRNHFTPGTRGVYGGFRCVLELPEK